MARWSATDLEQREPRRVALYTGIVQLLRAYGSIAEELEAAGYDPVQQKAIQDKLETYVKLRETIRQASNETLDLKPFEADMRHLIDTYIKADEPRKISEFDDIGLLDLIVKTGVADAIAKKLGQMKDRESVAETIENNVRSKIVKDHLTDPAYFARMSALLDEIIKKRRDQAISYEQYLKEMAALAGKVHSGKAEDTPPALDTLGKRALYNNLLGPAPKNRISDGDITHDAKEAALALALRIDAAIRSGRPDGWRGFQPKEIAIKRLLWEVLQDEAEVERIFLIIKAQPEY